jgi:hypothetical protein
MQAKRRKKLSQIIRGKLNEALGYSGRGYYTGVTGTGDHTIVLRHQKHLIRAHNSDLFMNINQGANGGFNTYISTNGGKTWTLSQRHGSYEAILGSVVQDPQNHDIYVAYAHATTHTGGGAHYRVYVDKLSWSGSAWGSWTSQFGGAALSPDTSGNTAYTQCDIAIDSNRVLWVTARFRADNTPTYYVKVAFYDLVANSGPWTTLDQIFGTADSGTEKYGILIAYGGATKKIGLIMNDNPPTCNLGGLGGPPYGTYKFWTRNDGGTLDRTTQFSPYKSKGAFQDPSECRVTSYSSHFDADIDSFGNIWFVWKADEKADDGSFHCRKYTDGGSWGASELVVSTSKVDHGSIVAMPDGSIFFVATDAWRANNHIHVFQRNANGTWAETADSPIYTGNYVRKVWPAKLAKSQFLDYHSLIMIWQENPVNPFKVYFGRKGYPLCSDDYYL